MTTATPPDPDAELARLTEFVTTLSDEIVDIARQRDRARGEFNRLADDLWERAEAKRAEREAAMARIDALIEAGGLS